MLRQLEIKDYKSIENLTLELGMFNIFIGENGCGKTNILEALAMAGASKASQLTPEGLSGRGVAPASRELTLSSFFNTREPKLITIVSRFEENGAHSIFPSLLSCDGNVSNYPKWRDTVITHLIDDENRLHIYDANTKTSETKNDTLNVTSFKYLRDYVIFNLNPQSLRGLSSMSKKEPLGIYGEGLDILLSTFSEQEQEQVKQYTWLISWLEDFIIDAHDDFKFKGHKPGRSTSILYFIDKFMRKGKRGKETNILSSEISNEGVLYVLFYLALFISSKTPYLFAIDNIETALNPKLCRYLIKILAELALNNSKQALITTHNPAILDGINLHDDNQRLFVVSRAENGRTVVKRIKLKPHTPENLKLSEMWMHGVLGGLPQNF